jgi:hypothetical protein
MDDIFGYLYTQNRIGLVRGREGRWKQDGWKWTENDGPKVKKWERNIDFAVLTLSG